MFLFSRPSNVEDSFRAPPQVSGRNSSMLPSIKRAADETGVSFDYLVKTAQRESNLNPEAKASSSSATGAFQFIEQTWLGVLKRQGSKIGLGRISSYIIQDQSGRYDVPNPALRSYILELRKDPEISARLAGAFTGENRTSLIETFGREPSGGELYIAHFLGVNGARDLISLARTNPNASAASSFPDAASSNRSIFYGENGRSRTAGEVYSRLVSQHERTGVSIGAAVEYDWRTGLPTRSPLAIADKSGVERAGHVDAQFMKDNTESTNGRVGFWGKVKEAFSPPSFKNTEAYFPKDNVKENASNASLIATGGNAEIVESRNSSPLRLFEAKEVSRTNSDDVAPNVISSRHDLGQIHSKSFGISRYQDTLNNYKAIKVPTPPTRPNSFSTPMDITNFSRNG